MNPTSKSDHASLPPPPYPFRHVEARWHIVTVPALAFLIYPVFAGQRLISWLDIAGFSAFGFASTGITGLTVYAMLSKRYALVLPRIVGGSRRLRNLAASIGFAAGVAAVCLAFFVNFHWKRFPESEVLGTVVELKHRSGKAPGWDAVVAVPDNIIRMTALEEDWVYVMQAHTRIHLRLQPGALGGAFVTRVTPAQ